MMLTVIVPGNVESTMRIGLSPVCGLKAGRLCCCFTFCEYLRAPLQPNGACSNPWTRYSALVKACRCFLVLLATLLAAHAEKPIRLRNEIIHPQPLAAKTRSLPDEKPVSGLFMIQFVG